MFRNVRIRTRLIAGFAMVMLLLVLLSTISIIRVEGVNDQLTTKKQRQQRQVALRHQLPRQCA